jgi:hypothetical protein
MAPRRISRFFVGPARSPDPAGGDKSDRMPQRNKICCAAPNFRALIMDIRPRMERATRDDPEISERLQAENKGERNG